MKNIFKKIFKDISVFIKRNWKHRFLISLSIIFLIAIILTLSHIGKVGFDEFYNEFRNKEKPFYLVNIAIVFAALATAIFTYWKNIINQRISLIQEQTRQDNLYAKAIKLLNEENDLTTRKGGVHILKDLALTSSAHAQKCIDMLCSLNESWMPKFLNDYPDFFKLNSNFPNIKNIDELKLTKDLFINGDLNASSYIDQISLSQLVLNSMSSIINHISTNDDYNDTYDLSYKYLCSIDLNGINFKKFKLNNLNLHFANLGKANLHSTYSHGINLKSAYLAEANLQSADLNEANLKSAVIFRANLRSTELIFANLQHINLTEANLQSAELYGADFQHADLSYANLKSTDLIYAKLQFSKLANANLQYAELIEAKLQSAELSGTDLQYANLEEANLQYANLINANFTKANLTKTNFRNAKGINEAIFDENKENAIFTDKDYKKHYPET
ncbi:MAG: pentapeptide repeat-containing protein [Ignavibacteria bacterium]|nr:pentapeptide repeat-containing protein [Bacteroidota bacterium]MBL7128524.1 pentapeptide repeat-containing protein [Ignavibacteria bacterium]